MYKEDGGAGAKPVRYHAAAGYGRLDHVPLGHVSSTVDGRETDGCLATGCGALMDLEGLYDRHRRELVAYATRLVVHVTVAEDLVQEAVLRLIRQDHPPSDEDHARGWLFRVVTNLAIDHLRRHSTWRELALVDARGIAENDADFIEASALLRGSSEMKAIANEHLVTCFACTLRNLPPQQAVALLLREVHGFSVQETADMLAATFGQAKNWIQDARRSLDDRYSTTCALITKAGVCYQCVELDRFFNGTSGDPLSDSRRDLDARLDILRRHRDSPPGLWHARMLDLIRDVIG